MGGHGQKVRQRKPDIKKERSDDQEAGKGKSKNPKKDASSGIRNLILLVLAAFAVIIVFVLVKGYTWYLETLVTKPLNAPKMIIDNSTSPAVSPSRFWGSYRPHAYFGMKTRTPRSPVFGLMWLTQFTFEMPPPIRHWCSQDDKLAKYGWLKHDGVNFGVQEIEENTYKIRTEFVKRPGGDHGGDWTARISLEPKVKGMKQVVSLMFYVALDGQGVVTPSLDGSRMKKVTGYSEELGHFDLHFLNPEKASGARYHHLVSYANRLDRLKNLMQNSLRVDAWDKARTMSYFHLGGRLIPRDSPGANFMVHQITAEIPFQMEVAFESVSFIDRPNRLRSNAFSEELQKHAENFDKKFTEVFDLENKGYSKDEIDFAKSAMSNMIGGIGYFYGSSLVKSKYNKEPVDYWEAGLYTGVPSRSFFPRGFLWDEGFHNLLISQWDPEISEDIMAHWLDLINTEGWIPREQILGVEARARVPDEFVVQRNENANPPTLFLPLQRLIKRMTGSQDPTFHRFLEAVFPRLKAWYSWYNTTQVGSIPSSYRWRGRDAKTNLELNPKTLTSGLDDYPRASHPTDDERHVDLRCWMALASGIMTDIAKELGQDHSEYEATHNLLTDIELLNKLHWNSEKSWYCDYGLHSSKVLLQRPRPNPNNPHAQLDKVRVVKEKESLRYVESFGYVSLFPFLLKILPPDSQNLFRILVDLKNSQLLWTNYGLRSLALKAPLYNKRNTEHDPPYWRGAIWINMNYLTLSSLYHYANTPGKYQKIAQETYSELRNNLVKNILKEYERTGYIYEQYDDKTGQGKGSHPFTGWSALVVLIMAEKY
ncbi:hypothetical protein FSP39_004266 [Pinctada imbricata]|uniref:Mannosyl-oligosaccharide glucosidase n=1 Tax=Pinctada imbricata TaxID=66713 RepID=A0AA89BY00_PINIB|nr:hypothetical protein FSP39_004266 [Pinctada imbricata]